MTDTQQIRNLTIQALLMQREWLHRKIDRMKALPENHAANGFSKEVLMQHLYDELFVNGDALAELVSKSDIIGLNSHGHVVTGL